MSESETKKGYNTNPLDKRVADRAEAEMAGDPRPDVDPEAPTREMPPEAHPIAGGPTHGFVDTAPQLGGETSPVADVPSGSFGAAPTAPAAPGDPRAYAPPVAEPTPYPPPPVGNPHHYAPPVQDPSAYPQWQQGHYPPQAPHTGPHGARSTGGFDAIRAEGAAAVGIKPNFAAMIAYTPFIGGLASLLLVVLEPPRNRFVRFHAKQALIGHICFWAIVTALRIAINNAPGPLGVLLMLPQIAIYLGYMIGFIAMMSKAYSSERFKIPIIGDQAE